MKEDLWECEGVMISSKVYTIIIYHYYYYLLLYRDINLYCYYLFNNLYIVLLIK